MPNGNSENTLSGFWDEALAAVVTIWGDSNLIDDIIILSKDLWEFGSLSNFS